MRKFMSWVLVLGMLIGSLSLEGCGSTKKVTMSMGQWLALVNNEFGMASYTTETPYFENITPQDPYFSTVQIAADWGVVNAENKLDVNEPITWEDALITLVNVGNFVPADASKDEKIAYAIEHFDNSIRSYWLERTIESDKAIYLLGVAQEQWANFKYDHMIAEAKYNQDVLDFSKEENKVEDYKIIDNLIAIPLSHGVEMEAGDVYVLPANEQTLEVNAHKVASTYTDENYLYIVNDDENIALEEIAEEIFVEGTYMPTMDQVVMYDGNGNVLSVGSQVQGVENMSAKSGQYQATKLGDLAANAGNYIWQDCGVKNKHTFEIDDYKISLEYALDGKVDLKASVETPNILKDKKKGELKGNFSVGVKNLEITQKVDFAWLKLKEASLKVDYETELSAGIKYSKKLLDRVAAPSYSNGNGKFLTNLKRSVLKDKGSSGAQTIASKKVIKICSLNVYSVGVAKVCLDVNVVIGADGSLTVKVTENGTKGLEYKNKNLRVINTSDKDLDVEFKGKVEATIAVGPALYVVGLKKKVLGVELQLGVGAEAALTMHLVDPEGHLIEESDPDNGLQVEACDDLKTLVVTSPAQEIIDLAKSKGYSYSVETSQLNLHLDTCVDCKGYFILKIGLSDESYAKELLGNKVKLTWDICGSKNAVFVHAHVDNFDWSNAKLVWGSGASSNLCTFNFTPFDDATEEETEEVTEEETEETTEETLEEATEESSEDGEEDSEIWGQELIVLSNMRLNIEPGEGKVLVVERVPAGYKPEDIVFSSGDSKVASVDGNGLITGIAEGNTMIAVSTSDGKYTVYCAINVSSDEDVEFEELNMKKEISNREMYNM